MSRAKLYEAAFKENADMKAEIKRLTTEGARMRHHLENTVKTMKEMGTQSGQTISTGWVLNMAESALPDTVSGTRSKSDGD